MERLVAVLQVALAIILFAVSLVTLVNMALIALLPETSSVPTSISVVNTIIGQTVMIVALLALGRILWKKGFANLRSLAAQSRDELDQGHSDV